MKALPLRRWLWAKWRHLDFTDRGLPIDRQYIERSCRRRHRRSVATSWRSQTTPTPAGSGEPGSLGAMSCTSRASRARRALGLLLGLHVALRAPSLRSRIPGHASRHRGARKRAGGQRFSLWHGSGGAGSRGAECPRSGLSGDHHDQGGEAGEQRRRGKLILVRL